MSKSIIDGKRRFFAIATKLKEWFEEREIHLGYTDTNLGHLTLEIESMIDVEILAVVNELWIERASVDELLETMGVPPYNDKAVQIAYKEGYNEAVQELQDKIIAIKREIKT